MYVFFHSKVICGDDKALLSQPGSEGLFFLSERISKGPLENYFGKQRTRGNRSDNRSFKGLSTECCCYQG